MKYLFISGLYPKKEELFFRTNSKSGSLQNAPNVFQWSVVDGLEKNHADFWVLSAPFIASYPRGFNKSIIPSFPIESNGVVIGKTVKYLDVVGLKECSIRRHIKEGILSWIHSNDIQKGDIFAIVTYTPLSFFLLAVKDIKKDYPNLIICSIVTDMIEDAQNFKVNQSLFKRIQLWFEKRKEKRCFKVIDKYVLLSKAMTERIPEAEEKNIIVEGIAVVPDTLPKHHKDPTIKSLLYTGSLHEFSGIMSLIEAFKKTDDEIFRLVICGTGPCEKRIREESNKDKRIVFMGNLERLDALKEQYKATVLINPRPPIESITRFSFPSKTIEYLSSGTPMIGYRLEGIPEEYYGFFFSPIDSNPASLTNIINTVLNKSDEELQSFAKQAFEFIKEKKSSNYQVGRIIDFIEQ